VVVLPQVLQNIHTPYALLCCYLTHLQRGKKRRWKEAYHTASDEVVALHTQLLAKHKDLEVLEDHLNQLQTELAMLGINTGAGLNTAGLRPRSASSGDHDSSALQVGLQGPPKPIVNLRLSHTCKCCRDTCFLHLTRVTGVLAVACHVPYMYYRLAYAESRHEGQHHAKEHVFHDQAAANLFFIAYLLPQQPAAGCRALPGLDQHFLQQQQQHARHDQPLLRLQLLWALQKLAPPMLQQQRDWRACRSRGLS
jgi:hypothetical protein